jgi:hypothetical protein
MYKHVLLVKETKEKSKKYGWLPPKEAEATPWDKMCIDLIGPYTIRRKGKTDLHMQMCHDD